MFNEVTLPTLSDPLLKRIRGNFDASYRAEFGSEKGKGLYSNHDWRRVQFAVSLILDDAKSVLDVGVGPGALLNYLHMSGRHEQVTGIDIRRYSKLVLMDNAIDFRIMDAAKLDFNADAFDVVVCMEVLEHMPTETMMRAIAELKRVSRRRLIVSVPYLEPEPLPPYHLQRFDEDRIRNTFAGADVTLLKRPVNKFMPVKTGWSWAVLVYDFCS